MQQQVYTVSELTRGIRDLLEETFPFVCVSGEISNFHVPVSKHFYFTLKDENAQIAAVMFRGQNRNLKFEPEDGMQVTGLGRISLYMPRGTYQMIFEYLEPAGMGALQAGFEQLKARLAAEGLFDPEHKKTLPLLPRKISIITSPTGAAVHDILNIAARRFPNILVEILPVKVQGQGAEQEIVSALELLNARGDADLAILARGGGSLEDLQAFNSEKVARAVFASEIPIISAVGHETDFTIADFVADLRAPTPSAAAELAVPLKAGLIRRCTELSMSLNSRFYRYVRNRRNLLAGLSERLVHPARKIQAFRLKTDELGARLIRTFVSRIRQKQERISWQTKQLQALNPSAVLSRGYSIARLLPDKTVIRNAGCVNEGQMIELRLSDGILLCRVEKKE